MASTVDRQDVRSFVREYEAAHPGDVLRVTEPISIEYDVQALALELERRRRFPVLFFEQVRGFDTPVIANLMASRRTLAAALSVDEAELSQEYARRLREGVKPILRDEAPFPVRVFTGDALDLGALPLPLYYPGDAARYITAGLTIARDPDTGVDTAGYHRFQLKDRDRLGVSLHSRRRMFEYQRRA